MIAVLLIGCGAAPSTLVGATLEDGQVLVGEVTTKVLTLEGSLGTVNVPLGDVGMVIPVERRTLGDSNGHVTVWLRNGSELNGKWTAPELAMAIAVGGKAQSVDLPTDRLQAIQLKATESWPEDGLYRVRTIYGDDFLVDPKKTTLTLKNTLGTFDITLAECQAVGPVGATEGDWRVSLQTGTVLVGRMAQDRLSFALPMGPGTLEVPLKGLAALTRGTWSETGYRGEAAVAASFDGEAMEIPEQAAGAGGSWGHRAAPRKQLAEPALSGEGWFENVRMEDAKR